MSSYKILTLNGSTDRLNSYRAMIYSDWLRTMRFGNDWFCLIDSDRYYNVYKHVIKQILERPNTFVSLAVLEEDPDVCLGWSLWEDGKLHYVFVKRDYRRNGIGKSLLPPKFNQITHITKTGKSIWQRKFKGVVFDPFG